MYTNSNIYIYLLRKVFFVYIYCYKVVYNEQERQSLGIFIYRIPMLCATVLYIHVACVARSPYMVTFLWHVGRRSYAI